ncbi:MAG: hypothetical protein Ct9H300mP11_17290 [Chloroflexota bacterium]|nr:MAG: hypothetical protein Ct9H300mP11_17290 [Chloroflexota bacterium]
MLGREKALALLDKALATPKQSRSTSISTPRPGSIQVCRRSDPPNVSHGNVY